MFVLKAFVLSIFERPLKTVFTLHVGTTSHAKGTIKVHVWKEVHLVPLACKDDIDDELLVSTTNEHSSNFTGMSGFICGGTIV